MPYITYHLFGILISGVFAWLIGILLFSDEDNKNKRNITQIIGFFVFIGLVNGIILPDFRQYQQSNKINNVLADIPFLRTLKTEEPALYQQYQQLLTDMMQKGESKTAMLMATSQKTEAVMLKRLSSADDEAINAYVDAITTALGELKEQNGELCFDYLFPQQSKAPLKASQHLSYQTKTRITYAMKAIILNQQNQALPADEILQPYLINIIQSLENKYGSDIEIMNNPMTTQVPKARGCEIFYDFYQQLRQQEPALRADLMRFLSQQ